MIDFAKGGGLVPAIVQHAETGQVLMLGYMNEAALTRTRATSRVTFWSRSRQTLWEKGETSGNRLRVTDLRVDCDGDAVLIQALPAGPTCHRGTEGCFDPEPGAVVAPAQRTRGADAPYAFLATLEATIAERIAARPAGSYVSSLLEAGLPRVAQKVGEEGVETVVAALAEDRDKLVDEAADLLFHLVVLLGAKQLSLRHVVEKLEQRHRSRP